MIYLKLFFTFFYIGLFTIGGGYVMIPMIKTEVLSKGWITGEEFSNFLAISESTPGPFGVNMATFVGYNQGNIFGAICATLGVILPSIIIIIIVAMLINKFLKNRFVNAGLIGIRPVVVGLILSVGISLIYSSVIILNNKPFKIENIKLSYASIIVITVVFILSKFKKINHPIILILISAVLGIVLFGVLGMS